MICRRNIWKTEARLTVTVAGNEMRGLVVSSSSSSEDNIRLERSRLEQVNINTETSSVDLFYI